MAGVFGEFLQVLKRFAWELLWLWLGAGLIILGLTGNWGLGLAVLFVAAGVLVIGLGYWLWQVANRRKR
jgi:hypothetical protein